MEKHILAILIFFLASVKGFCEDITGTFSYSPDSYLSGGTVINLDFQVGIGSLDKTKVKIDGTQVDCSISGTKLQITIPVDISKNNDHNLVIESGAVKQSYSQNYNAKVTFRFYTPAIYDGTYYLKKADSDLYLARGNRYKTEAILDEFGLPVEIITDLNNVTTIRFLDQTTGNGFLFDAGSGAYTDGVTGSKREWTAGGNAGEEVFYLKAKEGDYLTLGDVGENSGLYSIATNGTEENRIIWEVETPAVHAAKMQALRNSVGTDLRMAGCTYGEDVFYTANPQTVEERYKQVGINKDDGSDAVPGSVFLLPGVYKFSIQAFYRMMSPADAYNLKKLQADQAPVFLFIGNHKVQIHSLYDFEARTGKGQTDIKDRKYYPADEVNALYTFQDPSKKYTNTIWFEVKTAGIYNYGIRSQGKPGANGHWLCWSPESLELVRYTSQRHGSCFLRTDVNGETLYLSRGNTWGTQAVVDDWGLPVLISDVDRRVDAKRLIRFTDQYLKKEGDNPIGFMFSTGDHFAYTDAVGTAGRTDHQWLLEETSTPNGYYIKNASSQLYLRVSETADISTGNYSVLADGTTENRSLWVMEATDDHHNLMNEKRNVLGDVQNASNVAVGYQSISYKTGESCDTNPFEFYSRWHVGGKIFQEETRVLPAGIYRFSIKAFYRMGEKNLVYPLSQGGADCPPAYVYIGDKKVQIHSVFDGNPNALEGNRHEGYPDDLTNARNAFNHGLYENVIWFELDSPQSLTYGIYKNGQQGYNGYWLCWEPKSVSLTGYFTGFDYFVGEPEADYEYVKRGEGVGISCHNAYTTNNLAHLLLDGSKVNTVEIRKNGALLSPSLAASCLQEVGGELRFTMPNDALSSDVYVLTIPAGLYGYDEENKSQGVSITLRTPTIADGIYLMKANVGGSHPRYLARGGGYSDLAAKMDYWGLPVELSSDGNNRIGIQFVDTQKFLYNTPGHEIYTDLDTHTYETTLWIPSEGEHGTYLLSSAVLPQHYLSWFSADGLDKISPIGSAADVYAWEFIPLSDEEKDALLAIKNRSLAMSGGSAAEGEEYLHFAPTASLSSIPLRVSANGKSHSVLQTYLDIPETMSITSVSMGSSFDSNHFCALHPVSSVIDNYKGYLLMVYNKASMNNAVSGDEVVRISLDKGESADGIFPIYSHDIYMDNAASAVSATSIPMSTSYVRIGVPRGQHLEVRGVLPSFVTAQLESDASVRNEISTDIVSSYITSIDLSSEDVRIMRSGEVAAKLVFDNPNLVAYTRTERGYANEVVGGICQSLVVAEGSDFAAGKSFDAIEARYVRTMSSQWGALVLPFDVEIDNAEPFDFYQISPKSDCNVLYLRKQTGTLLAGTPVIVRRNTYESGIDIHKTGTAENPIHVTAGSSFAGNPIESTAVPGLSFSPLGTLLKISINQGFYVSSNKLWDASKRTKVTNLGAFRSYYDIVGLPSNADSYRLGNESDETGEANGLEVLEDLFDGSISIFDVDGRPMQDLKAGVNLVRRANGEILKVILDF